MIGCSTKFYLCFQCLSRYNNDFVAPFAVVQISTSSAKPWRIPYEACGCVVGWRCLLLSCRFSRLGLGWRSNSHRCVETSHGGTTCRRRYQEADPGIEPH